MVTYPKRLLPILPKICRLVGLTLPVMLSLLITLPCPAAETTTFQALFPVGIDHAFSDPEKTFDEVKSLILTQYYTSEITEEALYWAAIQGMLRHISPPETPNLSTIWSSADYEKIVDALNGERISIGVKSSFNPNDGSLTVTEVLPDSPAENVLAPYDRILRVRGMPLKEKSVEAVNALLSGEEGEEIGLTVNRDIKVFDITITVRKFKQRNFAVTRLNDTVALVDIRRFTSGVSDAVREELTQLTAAGITGLIIDLRNNPGGVFIEALKIAELFLPKDHILMRSLTREKNLQNYVSVNTAPFAFDVALLMNAQSASSAEILAGALQDQHKATLIGTRSFGKGIFEKTFTLANDMRVKFITGAMYSPTGRSWHGKGVTPDFLVQQDEKSVEALLKLAPLERAGKDAAIITALKLLRQNP